MEDATAFLATVTGRDRPGLTWGLCAALAQVHARVLDIVLVTIRDRLVQRWIRGLL
jgi:predicted amino acid-binding ACT domain protein